MAKYTLEEANSLLPEKPTRSIPNPAGLCYLLIGPPKWGKTEWACSIPDSLLLAFEQGHSFQEAHKIVVDKWAGAHDIYEDEEGVRHMTMTQVKDILLASDRFSTVIIDTADMAAKACADYMCEKKGWTHLKDGGDYGVGYDIGQTTPFRQLIGAIMKSGRGVVFITHTQEKESKLKKESAKKETSLPGGIHKFVHTQADVILHASFGKHRKGTKARDRILQTAADEETLAGNRAKGVNLPFKFIVEQGRAWEQWAEFFSNPEAADLATLQYLEGKTLKDVDDEPEAEAVAAEPVVGGSTVNIDPDAQAEIEQQQAPVVRKNSRKR